MIIYSCKISTFFYNIANNHYFSGVINNMIFKPLSLKDAFLITPEIHKDERGVFERVFCKIELIKIGIQKEIIQINHSITTKKATIRGMHFQHPPYSEAKIIKCIKGSILDVIIDIRKSSSTFLKWHSEILTEQNMNSIYVPEGFAHGFQTLEDNCELLYLHTASYNSKYEGSINFDDPMVNIEWAFPPSCISSKDDNVKMLDNSFEGIQI